MKFLLPIISLLTAATASPLAITIGGPFCTSQGPGSCNLGFEAFNAGALEDKVFKAFVYDYKCKLLADSDHNTKPGFFGGYVSAGNPQDFAINLNTGFFAKNKGTVEVTRYDNNDDLLYVNEKYPVFWYNGNQYGGRHGCACSNDGWNFDKGGYWACKCGFDCDN